MTFTDDAWAASAATRDAIYAMPFVTALGDGSLDRERFTYYMAQDALYLADYSRALAALGAGAGDPAEMEFWYASATGALVAERDLHGHHVTDLRAATMSPTCRAYTAFLLALPTIGGHAVAAAGVLPCFWIYADVGEHLIRSAGDLTRHPYGDWIGLYGDPAFAGQVEQAKQICNTLAERVDASTRRAMVDAFATAARYEWMFWDAAWRQETWPV